MDKPKKYILPVNNYDALREMEEKYYHKPTEEETRSFLNFWQDVYDIWRENNSPFELRYVEEKIRIRKELIKIFGIRS